jgi:hypothetical protein
MGGILHSEKDKLRICCEYAIGICPVRKIEVVGDPGTPDDEVTVRYLHCRRGFFVCTKREEEQRKLA